MGGNADKTTLCLAAIICRPPKYFAYRAAQALIPPASVINAFSRVLGFLHRAAA